MTPRGVKAKSDLVIMARPMVMPVRRAFLRMDILVCIVRMYR